MSHAPIPQDVIDRIRERIDIVDVVSGYVTLSRSGQNLKGLCPFHAEKTPSFTVSPSRQIFHCFGCGTGGSVFTFLMKIEGVSFPEAVRELGHRTGVQVPALVASHFSDDGQTRERLEQLHEAAAAWFRGNLHHPELGRDGMVYLRDRGIHPRTIEEFGLGLALPTWDGLLRSLLQNGFTPSELATAGLVAAKDAVRASQETRYYDRFRGRVMFPIYDLRKRVIAFGGRILSEGEPKYLNSPDTPLFHKGRSLYALDRAREGARQADRLVIVEGYFDAIALHQAGITNTVATLGTALTSDHLRVIRRFASKVVLLFDPDPAGIRAALRTLDLFLNSGIGVTVVSLPNGHDPDTFVRTYGPEAFQALQERAPSLLDFAIEHSLKRAASGSIEDRIRSVDEILLILQRTEHRLEKEEYIRRVAERLGLNQKRLIERYPELVPKEDRAAGRIARRREPGMTGVARRPPHNPEEWDLAYLLVQNKLTPDQIKALNPEVFSVPACRRLVELGLRHLDHHGRVLVRPLLDEALVDPDCAATVTELSMMERHFDDPGEHVRGCLERLERKRREQALSELIVKLRAAEREGRLEEVRLLNAKVNELRINKARTTSLRTT